MSSRRPPLPRGANITLTREIPGLSTAVVGIRWDTGGDEALAADLVGAAMLCDEHRRIISDRHFVFFNQLVSPDASVARRDELLDGDDEQIEIALAAVPAEVARIVALLYLNEGSPTHRSIGQLRSCVVRILDGDTRAELIRSEDLAAALSGETALVLGELYRHPDGWRFRVIGQGFANGLDGVVESFGIPR